MGKGITATMAALAVALVAVILVSLVASRIMPPPAFVLSTRGYRIRPVGYPWLQSLGDRLRGRRYLTLTFDDGPYGDGVDEQLLSILRKHHAKAVFFVVCDRLALADGTLLQQIRGQGSVVGNHSFDHAHLPALGPGRLHHQVVDCSRAIARRTGRRPVFFRPPFGQDSPGVRGLVRASGMREMLWDANSQDSWLTRPQQIRSWISRESGNFSILLMHSKPATATVLDRALTELERRGFEFVLPEQEPVQASPQAAS